MRIMSGPGHIGRPQLGVSSRPVRRIVVLGAGRAHDTSARRLVSIRPLAWVKASGSVTDPDQSGDLEYRLAKKLSVGSVAAGRSIDWAMNCSPVGIGEAINEP